VAGGGTKRANFSQERRTNLYSIQAVKLAVMDHGAVKILWL
jgi:hypothetical protein